MANERFKVGWYRTFNSAPPRSSNGNNDIPVPRCLGDDMGDLTSRGHTYRLAANTLSQDLCHSSVTTMC